MNRRLIDDIVHVWSIFDNAWIPETAWDEIERQRLERRATAN